MNIVIGSPRTVDAGQYLCRTAHYALFRVVVIV